MNLADTFSVGQQVVVTEGLTMLPALWGREGTVAEVQNDRVKVVWNTPYADSIDFPDYMTFYGLEAMQGLMTRARFQPPKTQRNTPIVFGQAFDSPIGLLAAGTQAWAQGAFGGQTHVVVDSGPLMGQEFDVPSLLLDQVSQVRATQLAEPQVGDTVFDGNEIGYINRYSNTNGTYEVLFNGVSGSSNLFADQLVHGSQPQTWTVVRSGRLMRQTPFSSLVQQLNAGELPMVTVNQSGVTSDGVRLKEGDQLQIVEQIDDSHLKAILWNTAISAILDPYDTLLLRSVVRGQRASDTMALEALGLSQEGALEYWSTETIDGFDAQALAEAYLGRYGHLQGSALDAKTVSQAIADGSSVLLSWANDYLASRSRRALSPEAKDALMNAVYDSGLVAPDDLQAMTPADLGILAAALEPYLTTAGGAEAWAAVQGLGPEASLSTLLLAKGTNRMNQQALLQQALRAIAQATTPEAAQAVARRFAKSVGTTRYESGIFSPNSEYVNAQDLVNALYLEFGETPFRDTNLKINDMDYLPELLAEGYLIEPQAGWLQVVGSMLD